MFEPAHETRHQPDERPPQTRPRLDVVNGKETPRPTTAPEQAHDPLALVTAALFVASAVAFRESVLSGSHSLLFALGVALLVMTIVFPSLLKRWLLARGRSGRARAVVTARGGQNREQAVHELVTR